MEVWFGFFAAMFLVRGGHTECWSEERKEGAMPVNDIDLNMTYQCPYVPYCRYDQNEFLTTSNDDGDGQNRSCCKPCETTQHCKMACCPEIVPCTLPAASPSAGDRVCIPAKFKLDHEDGILVIATCKEDSDNGRQSMCLQKYDTGTVSPVDIVPVTDYTTFKVYRNVHCALCNGVETTDVKYWLPKVLCKHSTDMVSFSKILDKCHVKYMNPYPGIPPPRCSFIINSCNVTGLPIPPYIRKEVNEQCEQLPVNASKYVYKFDMIFKNFQCRQCNGFYGGGNNILIPTGSFSVVLGVDGLHMYTTRTSPACPTGMIFIQHKGRCLDARCSLLRRLHKGSCQKQVSLVESFTYRIIYRITFDTQLDIATAYGLANQTAELVDNLLLSVFETVIDVFHQAVLVADTKMHDEITTADITNASLVYIEIQTQLKFNMLHNPEERLKSLLSKGTRFTLRMNGTVGYITLRMKDGFPVDGRTMDFFHCPTQLIVYGRCLNVIYPERFTLRKLLIAKDNFTVVPFYGNSMDEIDSELNVLEYRDCVFVPVQKTETDWLETDYGLRLTRPGFLLSLSEFVYGENDDVIWICLETYNRLHNYGPRNSPMSYFYLSTYLLLCAALTR